MLASRTRLLRLPLLSLPQPLFPLALARRKLIIVDRERSEINREALSLVVTGTSFASSSTAAAATAVGAANAGTLPASGAMSSVRLPAATTILGSLAAIAVALTL